MSAREEQAKLWGWGLRPGALALLAAPMAPSPVLECLGSSCGLALHLSPKRPGHEDSLEKQLRPHPHYLQ